MHLAMLQASWWILYIVGVAHIMQNLIVKHMVCIVYVSVSMHVCEGLIEFGGYGLWVERSE